MIKAAIIPISIALLLASIPGSHAQQVSADGAIGEALRRQAAVKELHDKIEQAGAAQRRHDLPQSAKLYDAAWDLVVYIGPYRRRWNDLQNTPRDVQVVPAPAV